MVCKNGLKVALVNLIQIDTIEFWHRRFGQRSQQISCWVNKTRIPNSLSTNLQTWETDGETVYQKKMLTWRKVAHEVRASIQTHKQLHAGLVEERNPDVFPTFHFGSSFSPIVNRDFPFTPWAATISKLKFRVISDVPARHAQVKQPR